MFLYELALELGVRSTDLVQRAADLGYPGLSPSSMLSNDQTAHLRSVLAPPPPPPPLGTPASPPAAPAGPGSAEGSDAMGTTVMVAIAVAALLVVGLFGYMVTHSSDPAQPVASGPSKDDVESDVALDTSPDPAVGTDTAGGEPCDDAEAPAAVRRAPSAPLTVGCDDGIAGGLSGTPSTTSTTRPAGYDPVVDSPVDKEAFCRTARATLAFELRMVEAADPNSLGPMRDVMIGGREQWVSDMNTMIASAPPRIEVPLELYRHVYTDLLLSVAPDADDMDVAVAFLNAQATDLRHASTEISLAVKANCS